MMKKKAYQLLCDDLSEKISSHELLPGMSLPSENTLADIHKVSRPTVRKALDMLQSEGLIIIKPGIGSFVCSTENAGSAHSFTIGIDSTGEMAPHYNHLIFQGAMKYCDTSGARLVRVGSNGINRPRENGIDGIILSCATPGEYERYNEIAASGVPVILINRFPAQENLAYISVDYKYEAWRAVDYLLMLGHRDIAVLGAGSYDNAEGLRTEGWRQAYAKRGLIAPEHLCIDKSDIINNHRFVEEFFRTRKISAVFLTIGTMVLPMIEALSYVGLRIPDDLSAICFDDVEDILRFCSMQVSCIKMPLDRMGYAAAEYICKKKRDGSVPVMRLVEEASLVINRSCRPLNG